MKERYDDKGRKLQKGETQRKDGRYMYKYMDSTGKTKYLYSWRLEHTDPVDKDKSYCVDLRTLEERSRVSDIIPENKINNVITVLDLVEMYVKQRQNMSLSTIKGYNTVINFLRKDKFGTRNIKDVKISEAKKWLIDMQKKGRRYSSIHTIRGVVRPAFQMAFEDDIIDKNPFAFELTAVLVNDSESREAFTRTQERIFMEFIKNDEYYSMYYDIVYILFNTGLRISELCGLTRADIDFNRKLINVNHQLLRENKQYRIIDTKSKSGHRLIPITEEVMNCFKRIMKKNDNNPGRTISVGSYSDFVFLNDKGKIILGYMLEKYFQRICLKYNSIYKNELPRITPHVARHTFCSKMAKSGMNPKVLQYIMGHARIDVTLNVYTHIDFEYVTEEMQKISRQNEKYNNKIKQ